MSTIEGAISLFLSVSLEVATTGGRLNPKRIVITVRQMPFQCLLLGTEVKFLPHLHDAVQKKTEKPTIRAPTKSITPDSS